MPNPGSTATFPVILQDVSGDPLIYADKAAFTSAGWDIIFYDNTGAPLGTQPVWDLLIGTNSVEPDTYQVQYVVPAGEYTAVIDIPGDNFVSPSVFSDRGETSTGETVTNAQIYAAIIQSGGALIAPTTTSSAITVYQDDSISVDIPVTEAALAAIGVTSLADCDSISAQLKLNDTNATVSAEVTTFNELIISDVSENRLVRASLDSYPVELDVNGPQGASVGARLDLRITEGTKTIIAGTVDVTAVWAAAAGM